jgi:hypothetical protein
MTNTARYEIGRICRIALIGLLWSILFIVSRCYHGHGLSPTGGEAAASSGLSGTIRFTGECPDSTRQINIVISKKYPAGITNTDSLYDFVISELYAGNIVLGDTLSRNVAEITYLFNIDPGYYEWVLVVWFPDIPDYLTGVKELGAYTIGDKSLPEPVYIPPGEIIQDIDIVADFENVNRDIPFFKQ